MDAALIAVLGTLLGVAATHWFQTRAAVRTATLARDEQLRQERITTYSAFAGALVDYRHSQNDRWFRALEVPGTDTAEEARYTSYARRRAASQALFRVQLVCDDPQTRQLAEDAFEVTNRIHEATDEEARKNLGAQAKEAIALFISAAAPGVR